LLPLLFGACEETTETPVDPGPNTSFWISLTVNNSIALEYLPVRILIQTDEADDEKTAQLGQTAVSPIAGTQRYKITLPESYVDRRLRFVVEFRKAKSVFDEIYEIKKSSMALNLLKARYCVIEGQVPNKAIKDIELNIGANSELKFGFGPNGVKLSDIPDAPLIFLLNIVQGEEIKGYEFEFLVAMAVPAGSPSPGFTKAIDDLNNGIEGVYGFSVMEMDWAMVMLPVYKQGDPFDILLFARQPPDTKVCPCKECGEDGEGKCQHEINLTDLYGESLLPVLAGFEPDGICPYEFAANHGYPHTIRRQVTEADIESMTNDDGTLETGSGIQIYVHEAVFETCEEFKEDMEAEISKLVEQ
jgi:hypothetical protein